ncbi:hypothetical protein HID58_057366 [Brassica napus]|uniref:Uncharacterized protein n=3 Tax=Brassica TaxID=3705 RepID=A0ABQ8ARS5_BRANA|nr:hypothetical protein HID58_057366 [Brassica napus]
MLKVALGDGVLLLEVRTSRRAVDTASRQIIIKKMERVRTTALMCIPHIATMRPDDMNRVQLCMEKTAQLNCSRSYVNERWLL